MQKIRALLEVTNGQFTDTTIPPAEVPPLANAVAKLRKHENKRSDWVTSTGLAAKRLAIRSWYENTLLTSSYEDKIERGLEDMMHTPRRQTSNL